MFRFRSRNTLPACYSWTRSRFAKLIVVPSVSVHSINNWMSIIASVGRKGTSNLADIICKV